MYVSWVLAVAATFLTTASPAPGQDDQREEGRFLREAAALESRGDVAGAERVLRVLLERHPTSSGGLFALERILRDENRVREILPLADRYLEREPRASGVRYLELRILAEIDSLEALEEESRQWIEAEAGSPDPYREIARLYERELGPERALELLLEGREVLDDPRVLAVEIGDLLARTGDRKAAVLEWSRAIGDRGAGVSRILRRLERLGAARPELVRPLVDALDRRPTTPDRRRAGTRIALEVGLHDDALRLARKVLPELPESVRRGFLTDLARLAEEEGAGGVTVWAYRTLRESARDEGERRALDVRIASAALAAGDTAFAVEAQRRLARALPPESAERRRVLADLIRVEAGRAEPEAVVGRLRAFRREFPDAPELDELASLTAARLDARGREERALEVLQGVAGPRSAMERAFLRLEDGEIEAGRDLLERAVGGLSPARATEVIQLLSLLERLGPAGGELAVTMAVRAHRGAPADALALVVDDLTQLPRTERPALLAHGARIADRAGLEADAAALRSRLMEGYPDAAESAEAALALARFRARRQEGVAEAVRLLEELILERPDSPVVPDARRELQRLRDRVPGGAGR